MFGPNSTGTFNDLVTPVESDQMGKAAGVFYTKPSGVTGALAVANSDSCHTAQAENAVDGIGFNLSRSSSIYSGSALQPKALAILPCIRY